jgi:hypothetical protein
MTDLGTIARDIMFRDDAAQVLTEHASFTWNKAETRIRCNGDACAEIMDVAGGPDGPEVIAVFARHQAEKLPVLPEPEAAPEPELTAPDEQTAPEADEAQDPTPEPAGEPVETTTSVTEAEAAPAPKVRRDTKALTATIAEINKGDRVTAFFNHPRYGQFAVEGTVTKGGAGLDRNQLMVGGWYINLNERAAKYLQDLVIVAPAGKHEFAIPKPSEATEHVGIGG